MGTKKVVSYIEHNVTPEDKDEFLGLAEKALEGLKDTYIKKGDEVTEGRGFLFVGVSGTNQKKGQSTILGAGSGGDMVKMFKKLLEVDVIREAIEEAQDERHRDKYFKGLITGVGCVLMKEKDFDEWQKEVSKESENDGDLACGDPSASCGDGDADGGGTD